MVIGNFWAFAKEWWDEIDAVYVPLRGNGYRKSTTSTITDHTTAKVSVPLRGNGYRKCYTLMTSQLQAWSFPSPCGVMVIGNFGGSVYTMNDKTVFPSPCGVMVIGN